MNRFWNDLILPLFYEFKPEVIVEIGCFKGENTKNILEYCYYTNSKLKVIDPNPDSSFDPISLKNKYGDKFEFLKELSLNGLNLIEDYDAVLIDGDHNWYTVYNELKLIEKRFDQNNFPLIIFHDVSWPYARRDLYYNPELIPEEFRHPYKNLAMFPDKNELGDIGLNPTFNNAVFENTPKNGVLTAIEDFLDETNLNLSFFCLNAFYGFGVLFPSQSCDEKTILQIFYDSDVIGLLEKTYLKLRFTQEHIIKNKNIEINNLKDMNNSLNKKNIDLTGINSNLEKELDKLNNTKTEIEKELDKLNNTNIDLKEKLIISTNNQKELEKLLDNLKDDKTYLENELKDLNNTKTEIEKELNKVTNDKTNLKIELNNINNTNIELEKIVDDLCNEKSSLKNKINDLEYANQRTLKTIENLNGDIYSKTYENDSLKEDNLLLTKTNKDFLEDIKNLNNLNYDLEQKILNLEEEKNSILSSKTWKFGAPFRKISNIFNKN
ncbi:hypothetical protein mru_1063 [Methanobrevibacter ruminantium M1]|uniref:Uncharacterized protein n=1 Tax=Methanobrevibacter ruminantium (strain ATCC 35063 / DSM 1093 / JCM 13430 / OCM 146 / M1) TaxID=634498 RepID=D3E303_METRM|nr:class I SAM-dependent methyltransferase [Methanobrevibacter ruminantium]ADC46914.1 hypothetical protein mru_1063 [Methanobrevibacter ruminantium M1]